MKDINSRSYLESLSTAELIKLAENYGIDIPADLERIFIIEELLECSETDKKESKDDIQIIPEYSDTVELPVQYSISYIDILVRDPLWIYAFWEIKNHDREMYENSDKFKNYCLRLVPLNNDDSFCIPISNDDTARYLGITEHAEFTPNSYKIRLCAVLEDTEHQLAESKPFTLPRLITNEDIITMKTNPLLRLSGIEDISAIVDRQLSLKEQ